MSRANRSIRGGGGGSDLEFHVEWNGTACLTPYEALTGTHIRWPFWAVSGCAGKVANGVVGGLASSNPLWRFHHPIHFNWCGPRLPSNLVGWGHM